MLCLLRIKDVKDRIVLKNIDNIQLHTHTCTCTHYVYSFEPQYYP